MVHCCYIWWLTSVSYSLQVFEVAVRIPGKSLGAAIKALEGKLTDDAYRQLTAFHQNVVKFLQQSSRGEVEEGLPEELNCQVSPIKSMLASASTIMEESL